FSLSQLSFIQGRNKKVLVEAVCTEQYSSLPQDFARLQAAFQISYLIDQHVPEEEKSEEVWDLLCASLAALEAGSPPEKVHHSFSLRFMALAGYGGKLSYETL
ncbi:MAG: DNA repair protein RecO C-terminal domain-containing protein, partial [bacterium]|nr:DNA repair protein RecO C-terminal domain-containing protein [bacterium]